MAISSYIHRQAPLEAEQCSAQRASYWMSNTDAFEVLVVLLCIFCPPLAIFLECGLGGQLILSICLTLIGYLPDLVHALIVCMSREARYRRFQALTPVQPKDPKRNGPTMRDWTRSVSSDDDDSESDSIKKDRKPELKKEKELGRSRKSREGKSRSTRNDRTILV